MIIFWTIFIVLLVVISLCWYLTSYKTLKSAAWSFSLKNNPELNDEINQINQSLEKILGLITTKPEKESNTSSTSTNDGVIEKIKHQLIEADKRR